LVVNYMGAGIVAASQIVAVPYYLRFLDRDGWGIVSIILSWAAALMILEGGITLSVSRHFAVTKDTAGASLNRYLRRIEKRYFVAALVCGALGLSMQVALAGFMFGASGVAQSRLELIPLVLYLTAAQFAGAPYRGALVGVGAHPQLNLSLAFFAIAKHAVAVTLASRWGTATAVAVSLTAVALIEAFVRRGIAFRSLSRLSPAKDPGLAYSPAVARGPLLLMAGTAVGAGMAQADRLYLSGHAAPADFGAYAVAVTLSMAALQLIYPISQSLIPRLGEFSGVGASALLNRLRLLMLAAVLAVMLVVYEFGGDALSWWLRDDVLARAVFPLLLAHLVGTGLNAVCVTYHVRLLARHQDMVILAINVLALLMQLATLVALFDNFGAMVGPISWILANVVTLIGYWLARHLLVA
jgi:O-antigen/teichoic acid export membrane protein